MKHTALSILLIAMVTSTQAQVSQSNQYEYDAVGRTTAIIDGAGQTQRFTWDKLGRRTSHTNELNQSINYGYGGTEQPASILAPNSALTIYERNGLGGTRQEISADRGTTTYIYDAAGNLVRRTDARGARIDSRYDALNRVTERYALYADDTPTTGYAYTWDIPPYGIGKLGAIQVQRPDSLQALSFSYDHEGRLIGRAYTRNSVALQTAFAYDANDRLVTMTYPSGSVLTYGYDSLGRITSLVWNAQTIVGAVTYAPFGSLTSASLGNGIIHERQYDLAGRLNGYSLAGQSYQLEYNNAGQIVRITPSASGQNERRFEYDVAGRLTAYESGSASEAYVYDANANRTALTRGSTEQTYLYQAASNRLQSIDGQALTHDAAGNLTADSRQFTYDAEGRLIAFQHGQRTVRYEYNGLGERSYKQDGASERHFVYGQDRYLLGEYDSSGQPIAEYVWLDNLPVAVYISGTLYYIESDHLGTPRIITDASQQVRWRWEGAPFGDIQPDENPQGLGTLSFNLRFPGQYYDAESRLHYNYFRDYDPQTGRYIQSDPIGLKGGLNTYGYANTSPIAKSDPNGLEPSDKPDFWWRPCNSSQVEECKRQCASLGKEYESCSVRWRSIPSVGKPIVGPVPGGLSCSCKDREEEGFCSKKPVVCGVGGAVLLGICIFTPMPDEFIVVPIILGTN